MDVGRQQGPQEGFVLWLANLLGSNESALRLLLSLLAGYPLAVIHRYLLYAKSQLAQHIYFTICGIWLCYFNFGEGVIHSFVNILLMYTLLKITPGTTLSVVLAYVINVIYLCVGYYHTTASGRYAIVWTTPHCVLTLRLIGLVIDVYDGKQKKESLTPDQQASALTSPPSLMETMGYCYYFGGFLVGPQFPMRKYMNFVTGAFSDPVTGGKPASLGPALLRLGVGIAYTGLYQVGSLYFTDEYMVTSEFANQGYLKKCLYIAIWGKFSLYKYIACWLITEGVCILSGLTYNGKDENGNNLWDGCANVRIRKFETGMSLHSVVESFNINTNTWMAKYCFKRLKFLGNKDLSHISTLMFLALWHGLYSGYFINFALEFFMIKAEKEMFLIVENYAVLRSIRDSSVLRPGVWLLARLYIMYGVGFPLVSFCLFAFKDWSQVYSAMYYNVVIFFVTWNLVFPFVKSFILPRKPATSARSGGKKLE